MVDTVTPDFLMDEEAQAPLEDTLEKLSLLVDRYLELKQQLDEAENAMRILKEEYNCTSICLLKSVHARSLNRVSVRLGAAIKTILCRKAQCDATDSIRESMLASTERSA